MLTALWIVNGILATAFVAAAIMKLARSKDALEASGARWPQDFSTTGIKGIAAVELVGAAGLILPLATGIAPILAPLAAVGLAVHMAAAVAAHRRHGESPAPAMVHGIVAVVSAVLGFLYVLG